MNARDNHFDDIWRSKAKTPSVGLRGNHRALRALALLLPANRLLDVGCGSGDFGEAAKAKFTLVEGVDISTNAVRLANDRGLNARAVDVDTHGLPYPDETFDAVTVLSVLQYAVDIEGVLRECRRVLKTGGQFMSSVPNMRAFWRIWRLTVNGNFPRTSLDDHGVDGGTLHYFTTRTIEGLLAKSGFQVLSSEGIFCRPRWLEHRSHAGVVGRVKREFCSGEVLLDCRAVALKRR